MYMVVLNMIDVHKYVPFTVCSSLVWW